MEELDKKPLDLKVFSSFILKIIAIITMTFDHLGEGIYNLYPYGSSTVINNIYLAFKIIGRLALPLFCFLIYEGVMHTSNKKKYILRLGIMAALVSIVLLICYYVPINGAKEMTAAGNIFIDLLLGALMIITIQDKRIWVKFLSIPILLFSILSYSVKCYEVGTSSTILWLPNYLRMQYDWYSVIMILSFFVAKQLVRLFYINQEKITGVEYSVWEGTSSWRRLENIICFAFVLFLTLMLWVMFKVNPNICYFDGGIQTYAIFGGALILLYNGKRGYNAKWFQYGCYAYYPLHIAIIVGILALIWGI